jgi:hypothetical protein
LVLQQASVMRPVLPLASVMQLALLRQELPVSPRRVFPTSSLRHRHLRTDYSRSLSGRPQEAQAWAWTPRRRLQKRSKAV